MRFAAASLVIALAGVACSDGPSAPEPGPIQTVCLDEFCVDYPADWQIELGEGFVVLSHPEGATASVGGIDMQGVRRNAQEPWPATPEDTMRSFWALLDDLGTADLGELTSVGDGVVDSEGTLDGMRLWHRLLVIAAPRAWGAELRAPNASWSVHAEVIVGSLRRADVP